MGYREAEKRLVFGGILRVFEGFLKAMKRRMKVRKSMEIRFLMPFLMVFVGLKAFLKVFFAFFGVFAVVVKIGLFGGSLWTLFLGVFWCFGVYWGVELIESID